MQTVISIALLAVSAAYVSAAVTGHHSIKDTVASLSKKCGEQHKTSVELAKLAFSQDIPKDDTEKCYLECVYSGVGVVHDGAFSLDGSKKLVGLRFHEQKEVEAATHLIETCAKEITKKDGEKCSLGRAVRECFAQHGKQVNFFPTA